MIATILGPTLSGWIAAKKQINERKKSSRFMQLPELQRGSAIFSLIHFCHLTHNKEQQHEICLEKNI